MTTEPRRDRPSVVFVQYMNPGAYPPIERAAGILADRGWKVLILGAVRRIDPLHLQPRPGIDCRLSVIPENGVLGRLHYVWFSLWVFVRCLLVRGPAWIYVSDAISAVPGLLAAVLTLRRVAFHEHDVPFIGSRPSGLRRLTMAARGRLIQRASLIVVPQSARIDYVGEEARQRAVVALNCPRKEEVGASRSSHGDTRFALHYHGSIVPERLPMAVLDALADLPNTVRLAIVGSPGSGQESYLENFMTAAKELDLTDRVVYLGVLSDPELRNHLRSCDIGLALISSQDPRDANLKAMAGASNKAFEYLAQGLAMIVSNLPDWSKMFVDPGLALGCNPSDPSSIASSISKLVHDTELLRSMGERGRRRLLEDWNYETQFSPVVEALER